MLEILDLEQVSNDVLGELVRAQRPILIYGAGMRHGVEEARRIAEILQIPVCPTWGALDLFPGCVGSFGTHGVRAANFAVQNADYILCVGSRLDTKAMGSPAASFAPKAKLVMVDIDYSELDKMANIGRALYRSILADARDFLRMLEMWARAWAEQQWATHEGEWSETPWQSRIRSWKERHAPGVEVALGIDPYAVVRDLGRLLKRDDVIVSDTGCSLGWLMQAYPFKGERFIHAFNQTPMGYGLPAAIGAACATGKRVYLVCGDGGLSASIGELATVARHGLPIKIIVFNNRGHAMCRQTQRQWLGGEYPSTSYDGGLACPDFSAIAEAYGIEAFDCVSEYELRNAFSVMMEEPKPQLINIYIPQDVGIAPQAKFGHALEDQEPLLPREELAEAMRC